MDKIKCALEKVEISFESWIEQTLTCISDKHAIPVDELKKTIQHLLPSNSTLNQTNTVQQCKACISTGLQCSRKALPNSDFCGTHINAHNLKQVRNSIQRYPCVFHKYKDDEKIFCNGFASHDKLVCEKHKGLQFRYIAIYKCKSIKEYIENGTKGDYIIDSLIETHNIHG